MKCFVFKFVFLFVFLFKAVLLQQSNTQLQCTCYVIPGTTECLQYDTRFQASSLDEAIASFSDLTLDDSSVAPAAVQQPVDKHCDTEECQICRQYLKKKLKIVGLLPSTTEIKNLTNSTVQCEKYNFAKKKDFDDSSSNEDHHERENSHDSSDIEDNEDNFKFLDKGLKHKFKHNRNKRQVSNQTNVIGRRFNLSCERKGIATDGSGMMTLCSRCWAWRELPENYSPRYMNELICDDVDNSCLSGYATCGMSYRSAFVVRNNSGVFNVITLQAGSFCECRVQSGSALESLVTGTRGSPLPSVLPQAAQTQSQTRSSQIPNQNSGSNFGGNLLWY